MRLDNFVYAFCVNVCLGCQWNAAPVALWILFCHVIYAHNICCDLYWCGNTGNGTSCFLRHCFSSTRAIMNASVVLNHGWGIWWDGLNVNSSGLFSCAWLYTNCILPTASVIELILICMFSLLNCLKKWKIEKQNGNINLDKTTRHNKWCNVCILMCNSLQKSIYFRYIYIGVI